MKNNYISYQDTVTRISNDTLDIMRVDTVSEIKDTVTTIQNVDSLTEKQTRVQIAPKSEQIKKQKVNENKINEQKIVSQNFQTDKGNIDYKDSEIQTNFLKNLEKNKTEIKPEGVFSSQTEQKQELSNKKIGHEQYLMTNDWILPIIFISLSIMIWVRSVYYRQVGLLFSSINSYQMSMKLFKDPSSSFRHLSIILNTNAALTVGLFLYQLARFFDAKILDGSPFLNYLGIVFILLVIYALQFIGYSILGNILDSKKEYYEFLHHTYSLIKVLGIIFIPFALIIVYANEIVLPYFLILGNILIIFFYFKRIQRGIKILMQKQFLKLHQILYFCSLEILPVMVILKYVNSLIERSF